MSTRAAQYTPVTVLCGNEVRLWLGAGGGWGEVCKAHREYQNYRKQQQNDLYTVEYQKKRRTKWEQSYSGAMGTGRGNNVVMGIENVVHTQL